ncbi:hypothetical protein IHQ72_32090 [Mesorhizobium onobrychidis]|uniref:Uncharacterized protein n=1 Tax=Mesorhizobium onobrychidis TaxID=2775404 RepID=A0ABY5R720_9HYPH|nr:hypothetical protein IHQ72_32090 [Mesorhizobium onobrychidis]
MLQHVIRSFDPCMTAPRIGMQLAPRGGGKTVFSGESRLSGPLSPCRPPTGGRLKKRQTFQICSKKMVEIMKIGPLLAASILTEPGLHPGDAMGHRVATWQLPKPYMTSFVARGLPGAVSPSSAA